MPEEQTQVILEQIKGLETLINFRFDNNAKEHGEIVAHQKETNGNVRRNTNWRFYMMGAIAVLTGMVLPTLFIVIKEILG